MYNDATRAGPQQRLVRPHGQLPSDAGPRDHTWQAGRHLGKLHDCVGRQIVRHDRPKGQLAMVTADKPVGEYSLPIRVTQGHEIRRPSVLAREAQDAPRAADDDHQRVAIGPFDRDPNRMLLNHGSGHSAQFGAKCFGRRHGNGAEIGGYCRESRDRYVWHNG